MTTSVDASFSIFPFACGFSDVLFGEQICQFPTCEQRALPHNTTRKYSFTDLHQFDFVTAAVLPQSNLTGGFRY